MALVTTRSQATGGSVQWRGEKWPVVATRSAGSWLPVRHELQGVDYERGVDNYPREREALLLPGNSYPDAVAEGGMRSDQEPAWTCGEPSAGTAWHGGFGRRP